MTIQKGELPRTGQPMIDFRRSITDAISARGPGAETRLAAAVAARTDGLMENVRSQISRFRSGKRADGARASLPLPVLEIVLDELGIDLVARSPTTTPVAAATAPLAPPEADRDTAHPQEAPPRP